MVRFENVVKNFSAVKALDHVSLQIPQGQIFGLIGSSGSGKSTLGKLALGLDAPDAGVVYFKDTPLPEYMRNDLPGFRRQCQAIFQDPKASLSPSMSIRELLTEPLRLMPEIPYTDYNETLLNWLHKVRLHESLLDRLPRQLSGGEAQRICLVRALIRKPEFLVCDEPTSSLDVASEWEIINLIKTIQTEMDLTVLFMTHNLYLLPALADQLGIMHNGTLLETGTVNQVFQHPDHDFTKLLVRNTLLKRAL